MTAPVSDTVNISITADTVGPSRAGFGTPLILSYSAAWAERVRTYSKLADVAVDFPTTTSPEYLAAAAILSQNPKPRSIKIGRGALPPTQAYAISLGTLVIGTAVELTVRGEGVTETDISVTPLADVTISAVANASETWTAVAHGMATGDGPYRLTNSGGGLPAGSAVDTDYWIIRLTADTFQIASSYANAIALTPVAITTDGTGTHTVQRDANDVIVSQLVDRLNSVVGNNYIAARVNGAADTDTLTVTADAAGDWFSIDAGDSALVVIRQTHADPGVATDLAAIALEDDDWYCLLTQYNSKAYATAAADWIEAQKKMYFAGNSDSLAITAVAGGGGNDWADTFDTSAYNRIAVVYNSSPAEMCAEALAGRFLSTDTGAATAKFKALAGVTASSLTATHRVNLRAKAANWLESSGGLTLTFDGTVPGTNSFIDVTRDLDWVEDDMRVAVFGALAGNDKVPFTDPGVAIIESEIRGSLARAVARGIFAASPAPEVEVPLVADVADADKLVRNLPDISWSATLAGAVHTIDPIRGVVSV